MNKSESIINLTKAMSAFQAEIKNPYNKADNPYFKSRYAPLSDILALVRPQLTKQGLSVLQLPFSDGSNIGVTTVLMHQSGEWIESDALMMKPTKNDPQGAGSAITYARRYALSAILGIASEDDDDANAASDIPLAKPSKAQLNEVLELAQRKGVFLKEKGPEWTGKATSNAWMLTDLRKVMDELGKLPDKHPAADDQSEAHRMM